jgi:uncharacterized membrane protein
VNRNLAAWLAAVVAMLVADLLWLGVLARPLYARGLAHLMAAEPTLWAAALFYAVYGLGLLRFAYSTYDLTNLATLKDWPAGLAFVDIGWGMLASAAAAAAGRLAWQRFSPR